MQALTELGQKIGTRHLRYCFNNLKIWMYIWNWVKGKSLEEFEKVLYFSEWSAMDDSVESSEENTIGKIQIFLRDYLGGCDQSALRNMNSKDNFDEV